MLTLSESNKLTVDDTSPLLCRFKTDLQHNKTYWEWFENADTLVSKLKETYEKDFDENTILKTSQILMQEHVKASANPGIYLYDIVTGKNLFKITDDMVIRQKVHAGEDGSILKEQVMIHPRVSSALILYKHENAKLNSLIAKGYGKAVEHLTNPELIIENTKNIVKESIDVTDDTFDGELVRFFVGKENRSGILQSLNSDFEKVQNIAQNLVLQIRKANIQKIRFISIIREFDSKNTWFEVRVEAM